MTARDDLLARLEAERFQPIPAHRVLDAELPVRQWQGYAANRRYELDDAMQARKGATRQVVLDEIPDDPEVTAPTRVPLSILCADCTAIQTATGRVLHEAACPNWWQQASAPGVNATPMGERRSA